MSTAQQPGDGLYLIDANVLIDAERDYYAMDQVPEFWEWLLGVGARDRVKIPREVYGEIIRGTDDPLVNWLRHKPVKSALVLDEQPDARLVQRVVNEGYAPDLNEVEIERMGQDPILISYALADAGARTVVTGESPKPSAVRANRQIPDVCEALGIRWRPKYALTKELGFSTRSRTTE